MSLPEGEALETLGVANEGTGTELAEKRSQATPQLHLGFQKEF